MHAINRTTHNNIPVIWSDVVTPLTGTLAFGVGMKDEPAHLAGITHLAEHLIFRAMGDLVVMHDGVTSAHTVEFYATGTPDEVADFLNNAMRVITDPQFSDSDVRKERLVIEAERPGAFAPSAGLLTYRYGIEGIGKTHAGVPPLASISADEASAWIRDWFVIDNARLMFTSSPPASLTGGLPAGEVPVRRTDQRFIDAPTLIASEKKGVALSMLVDEHISFWLRDALDFELSRALRTEAGLIYSIRTELTNCEPGLDQLDFVLDPLEQNLVVTLEKSVDVLRRVAREGFSSAAVNCAKSISIAGLSHPSAWADYVDRLATHELVGGVVAAPDVWLDKARSLDAEQLTSALRAGLESLIVAYDEDFDLSEELIKKLDLGQDDPGGTSTASRRGPGQRWRGKGKSMRSWVRIDGDDLHMHGRGWTSTTPIDKIVVAGKFGDGSLHLFDPSGRNIIIDPADWRGGNSLGDELLKRIAAERVRDFSWHDRDRSKPVE